MASFPGLVPPVAVPVKQASRPHSGAASWAAGSTTVGGSFGASISEGSFRRRPNTSTRVLKEAPQGSFGAGGWGPGGKGKYPRASPEECEKMRIRFRSLLVQKYKSVCGAWRAIDANCDGKLSYGEFLRACQNVGVAKGARDIWAALDLDRSGFVSVAEIDPELANTLGSLALTIWPLFGTVETAWKQFFNRRGALRISQEEFVQACIAIKFKGDPCMAYNELAYEKASGGIRRQEFGFLHFWISNGSPDMIGSEDTDRWAKEEQPWLPPMATPAPKDLRKKFKDLLLKSYRDFVRAWREGLDRDRNGYVDYQEFTKAVKDVGFADNPRELWDELDINGNGTVSLWELDLPTAEMLYTFNQCCQNTHGSWQNAWNQLMDTRKDDRVKQADFRMACDQMGYMGDADYLFELLDTDRTHFLSWATVSWVAGTEVPENPEKYRQDVGGISISGKYKGLTKLQQRRADINHRDLRLRAKKFEGRARGELPGTNPLAGTTIFSPGVTFNSHIPLRNASSPGLLESGPPKHYKPPIEQPDFPEWLLVAEGRAQSPLPKPKFDLTFPLKPQGPGKGGWPGRKVKMVDELWGGSKDIGTLLHPLARKACTNHNLARWQKLAAEHHQM